MATEVLLPHNDLMAQRMQRSLAFLLGRKSNPSSEPSRKTHSLRPDGRKRREGSPKPAKNGGGKLLAAGQVTVLKRGEPLDAFRIPEEAAVSGTGRLGPDPEMVPKLIRIGDLKPGATAAEVYTYAGSAFLVSPSPSSLPLPSFSVKKDSPVTVENATRDLTRLLRLE